MELDDLKTLWKEADQRLGAMESALRLSRRLASADSLDRMRSKLRLVHLTLWYEIAFGVLACLIVGSYLFDHLGEIRFALPAAGLHLGAILVLGSAIRQLVALGQIDYAGPVVQIQRRLTELRVVRARTSRWVLLSSPMLWALLVIVVPHGLIGLDVYRAFGWPWVGGNLAFGIAILAAIAWIYRRFPAAAQSSKILRWMGDDITGRKVATVSGFLEDLSAFEAGN